MKLNINKTIEQNIITVEISVAELGTSDIEADAEKSMLHDFIKTIEYGKIDFKGNMKLDSNKDPIVTEEEADDSNIVSIEINDLLNKSFVIDENLHILYSFDTTKILDNEVSSVFDTVEKVGKAKAQLFITKIQEEIGKKLTEIRALSTKFEGETEVIL